MRIEFSENPTQPLNDLNWEQSRRSFLRSAIIGSVGISFLSFPSCIFSPNSWDGKGIFTQNEMSTLYHLQLAIFPNDGNGPSAEDCRALDYFMWCLTEANTPPKDIDYLVNGLKNITQAIVAIEPTATDQISTERWNTILPELCTTYAHKDWLSKLTTLIFEAVLLDPVYGGNVNEIGWEWLEHQPGIPRPTSTTKYPKYLNLIYG
jgi:gluconate 2-dehydrogenase gamma chain